jgi:hypothetical protein
MGQKIAETNISGAGGSYYSFNITSQPAGTYVVRAVLTDRVITRKIMKF